MFHNQFQAALLTLSIRQKTQQQLVAALRPNTNKMSMISSQSVSRLANKALFATTHSDEAKLKFSTEVSVVLCVCFK